MSNNNTVEIAVRLALDQFKAAVGQLETAFGGAMTKVETEAALAGGVLEESFKVLGVKSVASVEAEVQKLQVALGVIRGMPGVLPADAERATQAFNARLVQLRAEAKGVPPDVGQMTGAVNDTAAALGNAAHKALAWAGAIAGVSGLSDLAQQVIQTGSAYEQLEGRLTTLLKSQEASAAAFAQIKNIAATTPFEVTAITDAYAKLTAFGLQPTEEQMRSMLDTAASLGGGTQMLERVTLALGQAWTKGKLQGGEIMQMAEAGVPVWDLLAKATGKNVAELQKLSEAGLLGRDAIKLLIDEMGRQNMGASATLMDTYAGAVSNAKDALSEFYAMIAQSGVLDYLKTQIQSVLVEFERMKETGELEIKAKAIAAAFLNFADSVKIAIDALQSLSGVIQFALEAFVATKVLSFASALRAMGTSAVASGAELTTMAGQATVAGAAASTAATGVGLLGKALGALKVVGVVALIDVVGTLAGKFFEAKRAAEEGEKAVEKMLAEKPMPVKNQVEEIADTTDAATASVNKMLGEFDGLIAQGKDAEAALKGMMEAFDPANTANIKTTTLALNQLAAEGKLSAQEVRDAWANALKSMSGSELQTFAINAQAAFNDTAEDAAALASVMDAVLRKAINDTGQDVDLLSTGMTRGFIDASSQLGIMIDNMDQLKASGVNVQQAIEGGILNALKKVSNGTELEALRQQLEDAGIEGDKAGAVVKKAFADAQKRIEDLEPGIQSVNEAFRALGMKTPEQLREVADTAKEAFEAIRQSGTAAPKQIEEAFIRYSKSAIEANGGVADAMLKAQAEGLGLAVNVGRAGDEIVRAADATGGIQSGLKKATGEAQKLKETMDAVNAAGERIVEQGEYMKWEEWDGTNLAKAAAGEKISLSGAMPTVLPEQMRQAAQEELDRRAEAWKKEREERIKLAEDEQRAKEQAAIERQRELEAESRAGAQATTASGAPSGFGGIAAPAIVAGWGAVTADLQAAAAAIASAARQPKRSVRVSLQRPDGRTAEIDVGERSQAEALINTLRDAGMAASRG
jgi:tape measure domain-containing protein